MAHSAVLVNAARVVNTAALRRTIGRALAEDDWPEPLWLETSPRDAGERLTRFAIGQGAEVVFVCGGDGTVLEAVSALSGTEVALSVVPSGTGNVLALNLGSPTDVVGAVRLATRGSRRKIDLGQVEGRFFAVATGIGLDAQMLAGTRRRAKRHLGWPAYAVTALRHLGDPTFAVTIRLDGGPPLSRDVRSVLVANVGRLPGGIILVPAALADDGVLDVALIAPGKFREWAGLAASLLRRGAELGGVEAFQARHVEITTEIPQPREIDGEPLPPAASLVVGVLPAALTVCVPGWPPREKVRSAGPAPTPGRRRPREIQ